MQDRVQFNTHPEDPSTHVSETKDLMDHYRTHVKAKAYHTGVHEPSGSSRPGNW